MRFTNDFWIKNQDAFDIKAGTLDGMVTDSNLKAKIAIKFLALKR